MLVNEVLKLNPEYYKRETLDNFINYFKRHDIYWGIRYYVNNTNMIKYEDMLKILNHYQGEIKKYIVDIMVDKHYEPAFNALCSLYRFKIDWPWVKNILDDYKTDFIKEILLTVKDQQFGYTKIFIDNAIEAGLDWPEIEIINKSLRTLIKKIDENLAQLNQQQIELIANKVKEFLHYSPWHAMDYFETYGYHLSDYPEFIKIWNDNKDMVVKLILKNLYDTDGDSLLADLHLIRFLKTGLDWPELDIIYKSLMHEYNLGQKIS